MAAGFRDKGKRPMEEGGSEECPRRTVVEVGRDGRYVRYVNRLGFKEGKEIYEGMDKSNGMLIAWKVITVTERDDVKKFCKEAKMLQSLNHENIIKCYDYWVCEEKDGTFKINMITELPCSWSVSDYLKKHVTLVGNTDVIKLWSKQILKGLKFLHTRKPRMILHRDLNCDNILICGESGNIKLANFDIACYEPKSEGEKAIWGEIRFREPDTGDNTQSGATDIYSFGMCVLQMMSTDELYSEIFRRLTPRENASDQEKRNMLERAKSSLCYHVLSGIKPDALKNVEDRKVRKFIEGCLATAQKKRPSASALLKHPFFAETKPKRVGYSMITKWHNTKMYIRNMPKLEFYPDESVMNEIRRQEH